MNNITTHPYMCVTIDDRTGKQVFCECFRTYEEALEYQATMSNETSMITIVKERKGDKYVREEVE